MRKTLKWPARLPAGFHRSCWEYLTLLPCSCDENNAGDGNTLNDSQDADFDTTDYHFSLRAERSGKCTGRIYTVAYTAMDSSDNTAAVSATVIVAHN